jgi:putative flippase GtrA
MRSSPIQSAIRWARASTNEEQRKIAKFIVVGVIKTGLGYSLFLLVLWLGMHHDIALAADYFFAVTLGYVVNRSWTFSNQGQATAPLLKYVLSYVFVYILNALALEFAIRLGMGPATGQLPCLVLATVASYVLQRYWVFRGS